LDNISLEIKKNIRSVHIGLECFLCERPTLNLSTLQLYASWWNSLVLRILTLSIPVDGTLIFNYPVRCW